MKIIDDFLPQHDFEALKQYLFHESFIWYYNDCIATQKQGLDQFQFVYPFFDIAKPSLNNWSPFLQPLLLKLKVKYIFRIKVNCRPRSAQGVLSPFHRDLELNQQTAIFYLNTNNGYTKFKDDHYDDVPSVANRLLTFHGNLEHAGCSATDVNRRVVLNINYIPSQILT
tara:strand:- start:42 stop:548 length:507 start_codon:yes stop_codon:yes gene_type:complete